MRLGLIGHGNIARALLGLLDRDRIPDVVVLCRPGAMPEVGSTGQQYVTSLEDLVAQAPDLVVECAGHGAVADYGPALLGQGVDLIVASLGALADPELEKALSKAARTGGGRLIRPSGAIGGLDMLETLARAGPVTVAYTGTKPPRAWAGSLAEAVLDLDNVQSATAFFTGTAREAAQRFPKNANVVAALALTGVGFDAVQVTLVADPGAGGNRHCYRVTSALGQAQFEVEAPASGNARTSLTTVYSLLNAILGYEASMGRVHQ